MVRDKFEEELLSPRAIGAIVRDEMFKLFAAHYDLVSRKAFASDLAEKDLVILLWSHDKTLRGFTTLSVHQTSVASRPIRYIFSGDTVMDSRHWGRSALLRSWFRVAGTIKAEAPDTELYWLLIVMGHRTYRIFGAFFHEYVPRLSREQSPSLLAVRNALGRDKFGRFFEEASGLIEFPTSRGQLAKRLQDAHAYTNRPGVKDFLTLNPRYAQGVELACTAELTESNMKSYAAVEFRNGMREKLRPRESSGGQL